MDPIGTTKHRNGNATTPDASPGEVAHGEAEQWYLPDWLETLQLVGWRWISALPAVALLLAIPFVPHLFLVQIIAFWKLLFFLIALPIAVIGKTVKSSLACRKEPFCIHCGYGLTGLPDGHQCPECGRTFSLAVVDEYRRDPRWFIQRYKLHGRLPQKDIPFAAGAVRRKKSRDGT